MSYPPQGLHARSTIILDTPIGKLKIISLYVEPTTGKLVVEYDSEPQE